MTPEDNPQVGRGTPSSAVELELEALRAEVAALRKRLDALTAISAIEERRYDALRAGVENLRLNVNIATSRVSDIYGSLIWKSLVRAGKLALDAGRVFHSPGIALGRAVDWSRRLSGRRESDSVVVASDFPPPGTESIFYRQETEIRGWAAARSGIARLEVSLGGRRISRVEYGLCRMDVAAHLPDFRDSQNSGFRASIDAARFEPGQYELRIIATSRSGRRAEATYPVAIDMRTEYETWRERNALDEAALSERELRTQLFSYWPLISIVCPVFNTPEPFLRACVASVRAQLYPSWELILADDGSDQPHVRRLLEEFSAADARIRACFLPRNLGIAAATNVALAQAAGEFVGFLDHDDELAPDALYEVASELNHDHNWDVFYSDEDKIAPDGRHVEPFFKPGWSPDLLLAMNYICHFLVCRRSLVEALGGLRPGLEGSQDFDLALRLSERTGRIRRIPKVLYHWRVSAQSTASATDQKPEASAAGLRAVQDHLSRTSPGGIALELLACRYRVRYPIQGLPEVAIIVPSAGNRLLEQALASVLATSSYPNYRIIVVDNSQHGIEPRVRRFRKGRRPMEVLDCRGLPFNFSLLCNRAARSCESPYLLFLNDDTKIITPDWIEAMLEHAQRKEVGAVGALLLFPDGRIQHAGVLMGVYGLAAHSFRLLDASQHHYFHLPQVVRNCSAVTGACMLVRREPFWEVGGFDEQRLPIAFQDVDFCLKLHEKGYRIIYTPHARLYHHESATKTTVAYPGEIDYMQQRWAPYILDDPYYNPNLTRMGEGYTLPVRPGERTPTRT